MELNVGNRIWRPAALLGKKREFFIYPVEFDWAGRNPTFRAARETTAAGNAIWTARDAYEKGIVCAVTEEMEPDWTYMLVISMSSSGRMAFVKPVAIGQGELKAQHTKHRRDKNGPMRVVKETLLEQEIRGNGRSVMPPLKQRKQEGGLDGSRDFHKFRDRGRFGSSSIRDAHHGDSKP